MRTILVCLVLVVCGLLGAFASSAVTTANEPYVVTDSDRTVTVPERVHTVTVARRLRTVTDPARTYTFPGETHTLPVVTETVTTGGEEPPPPPPHPASYYTGPLGQNNVLPADPDEALVMLWPGVTGETNAQHFQRVLDREAVAGRTMDAVGVQIGANTSQYPCHRPLSEDNLQGHIQNIITHGSIPLVTWTPARSVLSTSVVREIASGSRDDCLRQMADYLGSLESRVMVRFFSEMNLFDGRPYFKRGDGCSGSACFDYQSGGVFDYNAAAADFIAAWERIVAVFHGEARASNVGFVWNVVEGGSNAGDPADAREITGLFYPGNQNVDWVSVDRYNRGGSAFAACALQGFTTFDRIFNHTPAQCSGRPNNNDRFAVANGKPYVVFETSSKYDPAVPSRKGDYYRDIAAAKHAGDPRLMPNLIGVQVFDQWVEAEGNDWPIDSDQPPTSSVRGGFCQSCLDGWAAWVRDPSWDAGVAP